MKKILCALLLGLSCSAALAASRPDWTDGNSSKFPRELYMTGVGIASDRTSAEQRARAAVSRIFSSLVNDVSQVNASETVAKDGKNQGQPAFSQTVSQNVQITSDKLLEGVEVGDTWKEDATGQYYCLAVLDRARAQSTLKSRIGDIDSQIDQWNKSFTGEKDRFARAKYAAKMLALLRQRDSFNSDLRIVDPTGQGAPDNQSVSAPQLRQALEQLELKVSCSGQGDEQICTGLVSSTASSCSADVFGNEQICAGLVSSLSGLGFLAREDSQKPDIAVKADVTLTDLGHLSGDAKWYWSRATVSVSAKDASKNAVFLNFEVSYKSASVSKEEANRIVLKNIAAQAADKTAQGLNDYFQNQ